MPDVWSKSMWKVKSVIENDIMKILWDVCIQVDKQIEHQNSDFVVVEKNTKNVW